MAGKHPCNGCYYFGGRWETTKCCEYFLLTGQRRPCPAGDECIVRKDEEHVRRMAMTINKKCAKFSENI